MPKSRKPSTHPAPRKRAESPRPPKTPKPRPPFVVEKSAGAVVFRGGPRAQYLLIHSRYWEFPKGHIDADESETAAARREVHEETGLEVEFLPGFRAELGYIYRRPNALVKKQVVYFLAEAPAREVSLSFEHNDSAWLGYEQALAKLTYAGSRDVLRQAAEFLAKRERATRK